MSKFLTNGARPATLLYEILVLPWGQDLVVLLSSNMTANTSDLLVQESNE